MVTRHAASVTAFGVTVRFSVTFVLPFTAISGAYRRSGFVADDVADDVADRAASLSIHVVLSRTT